MQKEMELQQLIYNLFETQIRFGAYRHGECLPTIKEASGYFLVSVDTVRLAYARLKQEGYISLSTGVGAKVRARYSDEQAWRHIQSYFCSRREPLLAFAQSVKLLAGRAQWLALKNAAPEVLDELERSCKQKDVLPVYRMSRQLQLIYGTLGNGLLLRLFWQMLVFFQAPLVSVPHNIKVMNGSDSPLLEMIRSVRKKDWTALKDVGEWTMAQYDAGLRRFFDRFIPEDAGGGEIDFSWTIYKKTSQICYTLCIELLMEIREGRYSAGNLLPTPKALAGEKRVGVRTVRRAVALLNKLGVTETVNGIGTRVLRPSEQTRFSTDDTLRKRLVDFLHSLHIAALCCRACAQATVEAMDADSLRLWMKRLEGVRRQENYEKLIFTCYETISEHASYPAVRAVYAELKRQLFWGYPLKPHGGRESANAYYRPYLEALSGSLSRADAVSFSRKFEELLIAETGFAAQCLLRLGIEEAGALLIPEADA